MELEVEVRDLIRTKGVNVVTAMYGAPKDLTFDELVEFAVSVEYKNAFN